MDIALMRWTLNLIAFAVALLGCLLCQDVFTRVALVAGVVGVRVVFLEVDATPELVADVLSQHPIEDHAEPVSEPVSLVSPQG
jgi:hypothetical protein